MSMYKKKLLAQKEKYEKLIEQTKHKLYGYKKILKLTKMKLLEMDKNKGESYEV